ncbi:MAG: ATP-binding protein [Candidatus Limnocylindria bacterium]
MLSTVEIYSLGLNGLVFWVFVAASTYLTLGSVAALLWVPTSLVGALINLQSRHMARLWPDVVGGTPGYVRRLFPRAGWLGRYASMSYFTSWALITPLAAVMLGGLLSEILDAAGLHVAPHVLTIALVIAPYVVASAGTRPLSMLHVMYMIPTVLLFGVFIVGGLAWLGLAPDSPGFVPTVTAIPTLGALALGWFGIAFAVYGCDTATVFLTESKHPRIPLRALMASTIVVPLAAVAASLVLVQATGTAADPADVFLGLSVPVFRMFGADPAFYLATFVVGAIMLGSLSSLGITQRVLFQQARDRQAAAVFGAVSTRGVFGPALIASLAVAVTLAFLSPAVNVAVASGASWLLFFAIMHFGSWSQRGQPAAWHPWLLGVLGLIELVVAVVVVVSTDVLTAATAILFPIVLIGLDHALGRVRGGVLSRAWWDRRYAVRGPAKASFARQILLTSGLLTAFTAIAWWLGSHVGDSPTASDETFAIVLLVSGLFGVAIAGGTSLAQFVSMDEARATAEHATARMKREIEARRMGQREEVRLRGVNDELDALNRTQAQFVSIVSHEFRTPLTGIQGFSEMIRDEDLTIAEARDLANDINEDAQRLGRMITEILDLDRMRSGRMTLHPEPMEINAVIRAVATRIGLGAPDHPLVLALDAALEAGEGDRDKLTQVITNLINNAIKYSPGGSEIRISSAAENGSVHVAIADDGLGISAKELEHVFEPYSRVDTQATRDITGTGLGLPIACEIVRLHGGKLWAESVEGRGSTFHFTIARAIPHAEEAT